MRAGALKCLAMEDEIIMITLDVMVVMTLESKSWWW
jgi:hypothetical protein